MSKVAACARRASRMNSAVMVNSVSALLQCCVWKGCRPFICQILRALGQEAKMWSPVSMMPEQAGQYKSSSSKRICNEVKFITAASAPSILSMQ